MEKKEDGQEVSFASLLVPYRARGKRMLMGEESNVIIAIYNSVADSGSIWRASLFVVYHCLRVLSVPGPTLLMDNFRAL